MKNERELWTTNVGSHMWDMERPDSDIDLFKVYQCSSKYILMGIADTKSLHSTSCNVDESTHEIGKVIDMLIKGNVNFVWGVVSPLVVRDTELHLRYLKDIVENNLSKNIFYSINGLAQHNYRKYLCGKSLSPKGKLLKKLKTIIRTLRFGIYFFENHKFYFAPVKDNIVLADYWLTLKEFQIAYANCSLPEKPDELPYREYLLKLRLDDLVCD